MAIFHDGQIKDGFVKIPNIIFRSGLSMRAVVVLGNIMSHAEYFPITVSMIAEQLDISRETVNKAIQDLEEDGLIQRVKAPAKNGQWRRNDYRLNNNKLNLMAAEYVLEMASRDQNLGTDHAQNPDTDHAQNLATKKTISKTPSIEDQSSSVDEPGPDGFKEFWDHYPRKIGKGKAEEKYREQLQATTPDVLLNAVKNFATECRIQQTEKRYIPYPSTWLNQGRWKDYDVAPPATEKSEPSVDDIMTWEIDWDEEGGNAAGF